MEMNLTLDDLKNLEEDVCTIVSRTGEVLAREWQNSKIVRFKERSDPVTEFDVRTENVIRQELAVLLPAAGFLVEEGETDEADEFNWVIDPIDQTKNFIGQIPIFYVQVALLYREAAVLAVIYNPVSRQLFSASRGNGATLNGEKLSVLAKDRLDKSIVDIDFGGPSSSLSWRCQVIEKLAEQAFRVRMSAGSFAPYLLTGGIDLFIVVNETTKIVDQAPRMIIMQEAGLTFNKITIDGHQLLIAGRQSVVDEALRVIRSIDG
jgi:myo-inositol-1(or 4)-monophosphatase